MFILIAGAFFLCWTHESYAQLSVSGRIISDDGPISGANVQLKDSDVSTLSDSKGEFTLTAPVDGFLIISYIGYQTQEIAINNRASIQIKLAVDQKQLDEIVIVGYGQQKKENLTGAVSTVDVTMLESRPVQNAAQMLQGISPGLNITQNNGMLENSPSINIRGIGTIGQGSSGAPLILIDGMEGDINTVNPQDIEEISILKDAAASSIYGSRAPFGVVLIKTKTGKSGQSQLTYNGNIRQVQPLLLPKMMNSLDFATYFNDANINSGGNIYFDPERMQRIQDFMEGRLTATTIPDPNNPEIWWQGYSGGNDNVDWFRALYREQTFAHEHNLAITGGSENIQYYISGQYLDQDGLMVFNQDNYKRYSFNGKVNGKLADWASVSYHARFAREDYHRPSRLSNTLFTDLARQGWPVLPLYDPNGFLNSAPSPALGLRDGGTDALQHDKLAQQLEVVIEPIKNWKLYGQLNYRIYDDFRHWDIQKTYNYDVAGNPYVYEQNSSVHERAYRENYNSNSFYTEYVPQFSGGHNIKGMIGFQTEVNKYRNITATRDGIIVPALPVLDLTSGTDFNGNPLTPAISGKYEDWATVGYFGRINYNFNEKYLFEFNIRRDGSSRFRENARWLWSPSVSAGWNIAKESFWEPLTDWADLVKLRASYGKLGNQNTSSRYPTYVSLPIGTANGTWIVNGTRPNTAGASGLVSQYLTWESIRSWNVGLDLSFFAGQLTSVFDYFIRYTDNMVGPAPELPVILGTNVPSTNNTDLKTYGFEWELAWTRQFNNGLLGNVRVVLSDSKTKILNYPNPSNLLGSYRSGQQMGEIWGYETLGIAQTQEEMDAHLASLPNGGQNALGSQFSAGDILYRDINGDGKIDPGSNTSDDPGDLKVIGNSMPRYLIGLDLRASWRGVDVSTFIQGVLKQDFFQDSYYFWGASTGGIWWSTGLDVHRDYFRGNPDHILGQNLDAYYPRPLFGASAEKNQQVQTRYLQNASYIRLKNVQIGYTLPGNIMEKIRLRRARIFFSGENLLTLSRISSIFDPETIGGGWGGNVYPLTKAFSFGLQIGI